MTDPRQTPGRPTIVMKVVNTIIEDLVRVVMGLLAMSGGFWAVAYQLKHPPTPPATRGAFDIVVLVAGLVFAILGFLMMPYVFENFQKIIIFVFPGGADVPVVGHLFRRKDDRQNGSIAAPPPGPNP